ncbi:hypothetical protein [Streptomyces sp. NBC_00151]|uniref:hypothetical protein n=1 Tax=Streptomyces sp. NBC_00151 TaxID=2975669 RepID=UPI002DDB8059|nr:hypothetical protein [Streptomyces sp. NBC_00151]WRZ44073.1 hypothetical protein OG915_42150 [Streptomyces sp. NBC_00151]
MINELDVIDWSSMTHAYGPADEVPGWLKAAASAAPFVRAQLALAGRGDWFFGVGKDEELQRVGRAFLVRLG